MASEDRLSKERCVISLALKVEGTLDCWLNESMPGTISVHFGLKILLRLSLDVSGQRVPLVFIEVRVFCCYPIELDVIVCVRNVLFKLDSIIYKRLLFSCVDFSDEGPIKFGSCSV